jgi:hypothetical protein
VRALLDAVERAATAGYHNATGTQLRYSEPLDVDVKERMRSWCCGAPSLALVTGRMKTEHPMDESRGCR